MMPGSHESSPDDYIEAATEESLSDDDVATTSDYQEPLHSDYGTVASNVLRHCYENGR